MLTYSVGLFHTWKTSSAFFLAPPLEISPPSNSTASFLLKSSPFLLSTSMNRSSLSTCSSSSSNRSWDELHSNFSPLSNLKNRFLIVLFMEKMILTCLILLYADFVEVTFFFLTIGQAGEAQWLGESGRKYQGFPLLVTVTIFEASFRKFEGG